jgi:hypothetical protein
MVGAQANEGGRHVFGLEALDELSMVLCVPHETSNGGERLEVRVGITCEGGCVFLYMRKRESEKSDTIQRGKKQRETTGKKGREIITATAKH